MTEKKSIVPQIKLEIDGIEQPIDIIELLYQKDPYPGDHKYKIVILNYDKRFNKTYNIIEHEDIGSFSFAASIFWYFSYLRHKKNVQITRFHYFINNIERFELTDDKIVIEGVCSTICSPEDAKKLYEATHARKDIHS